MTEWLSCWSRKPVAFEPQGFESLQLRHAPLPWGFEDYLKDKGLAETTIEYKLGLIRYLELRFNLYESEAIREHIKRLTCSKRRKNNIGYAYKDWCNWKGSDYIIDYFKEGEAKLPYIPTERELDQLIAGFGPKYSAFLQLLKETGFRGIEGRRLRPFDFDLERRIVTLNEPRARIRL